MLTAHLTPANDMAKVSGTNWDQWFGTDTMDRAISNELMRRDSKQIKKACKKHGWTVVCKTGGTTHFKKRKGQCET